MTMYKFLYLGWITSQKMRKYLLVIGIFAFIFGLFSIAEAHPGQHSHEDVVVRTADYDDGTYVFSCTYPSEFGQSRTFSVRRDSDSGIVREVTTEEETITIQLADGELYHIGCQTRNPEGQLVRGDFHVDRMTEPYDDRPTVSVDDAVGLDFTATCTPQQGVEDYDLKWWVLHPKSGNETELTEFQDQETITMTLHEAGLWDITCGLWDRERQQWSQNGLPVEFFHSGEAYVPNIDGCVPGEPCPWQTPDNGSGIAPLPPEWLEPSENKSDVDVVDFHIQVFPMEDPDNDTHVATDFEMWDVAAGERVWSSLFDTEILTHIHNADGQFEGNLEGSDRLLHDHPYRLRARFHDSGGNVSEWSEWRHFRTAPEQSFNESEFTWTARQGYTVERIAGNISVPVNLAVAPELYGHLPESERPLLYVTQLYGKLGMIREDGTYVLLADDLLNYESFGSLPGSGETGVTGLYVDEATGDLFVSMVFREDDQYRGKVERFVLDDDGDTVLGRSVVLTGIPAAPSHQVQSITRGPDGKLYLNTGDADDVDSADDPSVLSGKILRFNEDGSMPPDNPFEGTYVYASGFRNPFGAAWRTDELYVTENGPDSDDAVKRVVPGADHGWCCSTAENAWHHYEQTVAPVQLAFNPGSTAFPPETEGNLYVALSGSTNSEGPSTLAKRIVEFTVGSNGSNQGVEDLVVYTGEGFGAPIGLTFGPDGLYFSDFYGESGFVDVGVTRGNVFLVKPGNQTNDPVDDPGGFSVSLAPAPWYPQGLDMVWECKVQDGVGPFTYDYDFGDGEGQTGTTRDDVYHRYPANGTYDASCTAHDQSTGESATGRATLVLGDGGDGGDGGDPDGGNASLTVTKTVVNDDGGEKTVEDFDLFVSGTPVSSGQQLSLAPGTYTVTETDDPGYTAAFGGACNAAGEVSLDAGQVAECTITNDDVSAAGCFERLADVPASCAGGTITQDTMNGCRTIICGGMEVLACEKPDSGQKEYFEMYKLSPDDGIEICLADTCISDAGYARSPDYPICTDEQDEPVCGNNIVEGGEQCDDGSTQDGDGCTASCQLENGGVELSIKEWYPQGLDVVFVCEAPFAADSYKWIFGDGHTQTGQTDNVFHSYDAPGEYVAECTATGPSEEGSDELEVNLT